MTILGCGMLTSIHCPFFQLCAELFDITRSESPGRHRFTFPVKVWLASLEERRNRFLRIGRAESHGVFLVLQFRSLLKMSTDGLPHKSLAGLDRAGGFLRQLLRRLRCRCQQFFVRHDTSNQAEFRCALRIERLSQLNQLGRLEIPDACGNRVARSKFRHQGQIDERHLELCALTCVHKIAMRQHGGPASDYRTVHCCDDWLFKSDEGIDQTRLRTVFGTWGIFQKVVEVVPRTEGVSRSVPKHDADAIVLRCGVDEIRHVDVHGGCHRIFLGWSIELDSQNTSRAFGNNVGHRAPLAVDSKCRGCGIAPLARKPSISSVLKPSSFSTSSLCSPIPGARLAGTLVTPCT